MTEDVRAPILRDMCRVACVALLLCLIVGCACESGTGSCRSASDCPVGQGCVDRRCVALPDVGGQDADRPADVPTRDVPRTDAVCAGVESMAVEIRRPIDAIVLPDESGSMGPARDSVAMAMETTFRTTMETAGIDYRVVWHGTTPLPMLEATGRVTRNPVLLGSGDDFMFRPVLDTYASWRPALRDDALKVFVHFTDAQSGEGATINGYTGTFDEVLVAMEPAVWGSPGSYQFVYHAFVGLTENMPPEAPYEPSAPLVGGSCSGSFQNPATLEEMARRTGGLRFPLCRFDLFDAVFRRIAESAIERASVACALELPEPPAGMTIDLATLAVRYSSGATSEVLLRAADAASCDAGSFLLDADRVVLCPAACARVEADPMAVLTLLTGCDPELY